MDVRSQTMMASPPLFSKALAEGEEMGEATVPIAKMAETNAVNFIMVKLRDKLMSVGEYRDRNETSEWRSAWRQLEGKDSTTL